MLQRASLAAFAQSSCAQILHITLHEILQKLKIHMVTTSTQSRTVMTPNMTFRTPAIAKTPQIQQMPLTSITLTHTDTIQGHLVS